ncbi:MAG TPA: FtsX-like permease family protein, partial [Candidatus Acidoferrales bacterium]|nr:FtsX-like permease family protein [Candidatus Acidoferrales bacterium]
MFLRIVGESFSRTPRRKVLAAAALALGIGVATATLSVALDVGDRLAVEFRSLGANLLVTPQGDTLPLEIGGVDYRPVDTGAYLLEGDLGKLKTIFWRNNIMGFAPFLDVPVKAQAGGSSLALPATLIGTWYKHAVPVPDGSAFTTGVSLTHPWWHVDGRWFDDGAEQCVVGEALARRAGIKPGAALEVRASSNSAETGEQAATLRVSGIVSTGGPEEEAILAPLGVAQKLANHPGKFRRLLVSALTKPEDEFARRDPAAMTPTEYDRWYCTAYISSIALQVQQVLPGVEARPIRRVAEGEGRILSRVSGLMWLVTLASLVAAALAVGATTASTMLERRAEVGLMKALGAGSGLIGAFFLVEQLLLALAGGGLGYALGMGLAQVLGKSVFGIAPAPRLILLPVVLALAAAIGLIGS